MESQFIENITEFVATIYSDSSCQLQYRLIKPSGRYICLCHQLASIVILLHIAENTHYKWIVSMYVWFPFWQHMFDQFGWLGFNQRSSLGRYYPLVVGVLCTVLPHHSEVQSPRGRLAAVFFYFTRIVFCYGLSIISWQST